MKTKAADLLDKLKSGTPLDTLAAADGLKIETASDLKRGGTSGDISAKMTDAIFHTAKDAFGSAEGDNPTQWIVFRVTDVKTPPLDPNSPEAKQTRTDGAAPNGRRRVWANMSPGSKTISARPSIRRCWRRR